MHIIVHGTRRRPVQGGRPQQKGSVLIEPENPPRAFALRAQAIGPDCVEVAVIGDATPEMVPALEARFAGALTQQRHVLLNLQSCDYIDPKVVAAISAEREHLAKAALDVMYFGASGIVRVLLASAFEPESEKVGIPLPDRTRLSSMFPRPADAG